MRPSFPNFVEASDVSRGDETLRTWRHQRTQASSSRSTRRVDWPLVVGGSLRLPLSQAPSAPESSCSVLWVMDELSQYRDESTLLRRAVELCRQELCLERVAIFLCEPSSDLLHGTWGTGLDGETTDEREIAFLMGSAHREAVARSRAGVGRWLLLDCAPLTVQLSGGTEVIGSGWNALTPLRSARGLLGLIVNDTASSRAPLDKGRQEQVVLFCALLGNLLELVRAERRSLNLTQRCSAETSEATPGAKIAARTVALLQEDTQLRREQIAQQIGVSISGLSRAFKSEMGLSVAQYRSRLRLERFLTLVDQRDGNLLAAALDAGFGSYAQFHRVFRSLLGKTPSEYLAER